MEEFCVVCGSELEDIDGELLCPLCDAPSF